MFHLHVLFIRKGITDYFAYDACHCEEVLRRINNKKDGETNVDNVPYTKICKYTFSLFIVFFFCLFNDSFMGCFCDQEVSDQHVPTLSMVRV